MTVLFAYAFPRGRAPTRWLWGAAVTVVGVGALIGLGGAWLAAARPLAPWLLFAPYALSAVLLLRQLSQVPASVRMALWLVSGALVARWLLSSVVRASRRMHDGRFVPVVAARCRRCRGDDGDRLGDSARPPARRSSCVSGGCRCMACCSGNLALRSDCIAGGAVASRGGGSSWCDGRHASSSHSSELRGGCGHSDKSLERRQARSSHTGVRGVSSWNAS